MNKRSPDYKSQIEQTEINDKTLLGGEFLELFKLNEEVKKQKLAPELSEGISLQEIKECKKLSKKQKVNPGEFIELSYNEKVFWFCKWSEKKDLFIFVDKNNLAQEYVMRVNGTYQKDSVEEGFSKISVEDLFFIKTIFSTEMRRKNKKRPSIKLVPED